MNTVDSLSFMSQRKRKQEKGFIRNSSFYTKPDQDQLSSLSEVELSYVDNFVVGNEFGEVRYLEPVNLRSIK